MSFRTFVSDFFARVLASLAMIVFIALMGLFVACSPVNPADVSATNNTIGASSDGIVNGHDVIRRQTFGAKTSVLVEVLNAKGQMLGLCSGTVIGQSTVLTAAHCFDPYTLHDLVSQVVIHFENAYKAVSDPQVRFVWARITHPGFNSKMETVAGPNGTTIERKSYDDDLAVLYFAGTLPYGFKIAALETNSKASHAGETVSIYAYGRKADFTGNKKKDEIFTSGILRSGSMQIAGDYASSGNTFDLIRNGNEWVCLGDSGSGIIEEGEGSATLVGVTSRAGILKADGVRTCTGRSIAVKVSEYAGWILKTQERLTELSKK